MTDTIAMLDADVLRVMLASKPMLTPRERAALDAAIAALAGQADAAAGPCFADETALADWLESLRETNDDGAVGDLPWEPAQRAAAAIRGELAEQLAGRLIDAWCDAHGQKIHWDKAVEIIAIVTKMPEPERARLLALNDEAAPPAAIPVDAVREVASELVELSLNFATCIPFLPVVAGQKNIRKMCDRLNEIAAAIAAAPQDGEADQPVGDDWQPSLRAGPPPEPVSHPSQSWCDAYAEWYEAAQEAARG